MKLTYSKILILVILGLVISESFSIQESRKHSLRKSHQKSRKGEDDFSAQLPTTPKAADLLNQYGYPNDANNFGPAPRYPGQTKLKVLTADGVVKPLFVNNTDLNNIQASQCKITAHPNYQLCTQLNDCDFCSNNDVCGWCAKTAQCLPGNLNGAVCPGDCISHWLFEKGTCTGKVKSGSIGNVAVDATKLINPEYATPKVAVNTITNEHANVNKEVQIGTQKVSVSTKQLRNGKLETSDEKKTSPIIAVQQQGVLLSQNVTSEHWDLTNGQKLNKPQIQTFGQ